MQEQSTAVISRMKEAIRTIPDFPKPGIQFKDITPIFLDPQLCTDIIEALNEEFHLQDIDAIVGIESRGFLFGLAMATRMRKPFVLIRKAGKLPAATVSYKYQLEYGEAVIEVHEDAIQPGWRVLVHDDLLATGGTAVAAGKLVEKLGAEVAAYSFLVDLSFLDGKSQLHKEFPNAEVHGLSSY